MKRALIGHTGFVGGTLLAAGGFTHGFNSRDFNDMRGARFDEVVCAGIPAVKWLANKQPEQDRAAIGALLRVLEAVRTGRFVLISTIDVYPDPTQPLDETAVLEGLPNHAYGRHRLEVEQFVASHFPTHAIVRLPALFGDGLKKNALFDLLHNNQVEKIDPAAEFQWYPTRRLPGDLVHIQGAGLRLVNLVTEPLAMRDVIARFFPVAKVGPKTASAPRYALRTRYAPLFGGIPPTIMSQSQVLIAMGDFVRAARRR
jgi:nucleoside-diphosphate-sugar epimerase